jgi:hypothetical protein
MLYLSVSNLLSFFQENKVGWRVHHTACVVLFNFLTSCRFLRYTVMQLVATRNFEFPQIGSNGMIDTQISVMGAALSPFNIRVEFFNTFIIVSDEKFD